MVSTGENFIGSQFFFTLGPDLASLDGIHCVIGEVVEGHEVLRQLNEAIVDVKHRPYKDIRITHTVVLGDPFADPRGFKEPSRSPSPSAERLKNGRIAADEDIDDTQGKTEAEVQEMLQDREAKARATILEIVGDIPDADVAPPENVLFVCKLNPVTNDDDLQIIFSRFGKIKTCEVIRDKSSGDSLQYAFIEFEEQKSCEDAYFKMDNVLIDDRRIHVDFSQSVSKIKWRGKGNYTIHDDSNQFKSEKKFNKGNRGPMDSKRRSRSPRRDGPRHNYQRRNDDRRVDKRNYDSRSGNRRSISPRRQSPPRRYNSPPRRNRYSPSRRSRSRDQGRNDRDRRSSPSRRNRDSSQSRRPSDISRDRRHKDDSPRRRRDPSPRRPRDSSPVRSKKQRSRSASKDSKKASKKSSRKHKKKSSKKSKKRDRSSSSSSSSSDSSRDHQKKSKR
jgi:peptidyl-prolyl cis-trans isomerase-like 4